MLAIRGFLHLLRGCSVSLFTDNTMALSYLRKEGGTRSSTLNAVAQAILRLCEDNGVRLLPQFVTGRLNVLADSLSRGSQVLGSEWILCLPGAVSLLASHSRPLRHVTQPPAPDLLFSDGRLPSDGNRRDAPVLGSSPGVRVSAVRFHSEGLHQGSPIPQP